MSHNRVIYLVGGGWFCPPQARKLSFSFVPNTNMVCIRRKCWRKFILGELENLTLTMPPHTRNRTFLFFVRKNKRLSMDLEEWIQKPWRQGGSREWHGDISIVSMVLATSRNLNFCRKQVFTPWRSFAQPHWLEPKNCKWIMKSAVCR